MDEIRKVALKYFAWSALAVGLILVLQESIFGPMFITTGGYKIPFFDVVMPKIPLWMFLVSIPFLVFGCAQMILLSFDEGDEYIAIFVRDFFVGLLFGVVMQVLILTSSLFNTSLRPEVFYLELYCLFLLLAMLRDVSAGYSCFPSMNVGLVVVSAVCAVYITPHKLEALLFLPGFLLFVFSSSVVAVSLFFAPVTLLKVLFSKAFWVWASSLRVVSKSK